VEESDGDLENQRFKLCQLNVYHGEVVFLDAPLKEKNRRGEECEKENAESESQRNHQTSSGAQDASLSPGSTGLA
jgi:hypothetical protein